MFTTNKHYKKEKTQLNLSQTSISFCDVSLMITGSGTTFFISKTWDYQVSVQTFQCSLKMKKLFQTAEKKLQWHPCSVNYRYICDALTYYYDNFGDFLTPGYDPALYPRAKFEIIEILMTNSSFAVFFGFNYQPNSFWLREATNILNRHRTIPSKLYYQYRNIFIYYFFKKTCTTRSFSNTYTVWIKNKFKRTKKKKKNVILITN